MISKVDEPVIFSSTDYVDFSSSVVGRFNAVSQNCGLSSVANVNASRVGRLAIVFNVGNGFISNGYYVMSVSVVVKSK